MSTAAVEDGRPARESTPSPPSSSGGSRPHAQRRSGARGFIRAVLIAVVVAGLGYATGRTHGWVLQRDLQTEHEAALQRERDVSTRLSGALASARDQSARLRELATLYESYRKAQQALSALDARNFGIAESKLREVERTLRPLAERLHGLTPIMASLTETHVTVADDLAAQRRAVLGVVESLDGLLTTESATMSPVPAPSDQVDDKTL